jgi:hypothetical protein
MKNNFRDKNDEKKKRSRNQKIKMGVQKVRMIIK